MPITPAPATPIAVIAKDHPKIRKACTPINTFPDRSPDPGRAVRADPRSVGSRRVA
ncbi:hypothetical protein FRAAL5897 [Frankia alni ACN14a]|uniref:Uncharacterized protein n=1 Tax=Frankia alni (strain DSM 45986 / CECT 9034 / ACN14a) TaxID=326424 RepID=Q0RDE7_FRAAA|nr:hypothetical protein FRAAL5897 [Frankia alni ACN14a]